MKPISLLAVLAVAQLAVSTALFAQPEQFPPNGYNSDFPTSLSREISSDTGGVVPGSAYMRARRFAPRNPDVVIGPNGEVTGQGPDSCVYLEMVRDSHVD
jgi:hypothetical protein